MANIFYHNVAEPEQERLEKILGKSKILKEWEAVGVPAWGVVPLPRPAPEKSYGIVLAHELTINSARERYLEEVTGIELTRQRHLGAIGKHELKDMTSENRITADEMAKLLYGRKKLSAEEEQRIRNKYMHSLTVSVAINAQLMMEEPANRVRNEKMTRLMIENATWGYHDGEFTILAYVCGNCNKISKGDPIHTDTFPRDSRRPSSFIFTSYKCGACNFEDLVQSHT